MPNPQFLVDEHVGDDYIVRTQFHNYERQAAWRNQNERPDFIRTNKLRFLRQYQINAIHALQRAVKEGKDRFLFEMATGTGKTLTAAAIIKLFLKTGNASRVLFLVDRLELEDQAFKAFNELIQTDFTTAIYKQKRTDWRNADIVVTTVQSLLFNNKYQELFSPTDFDFVISDEAHRSITGSARAVFDYFMGYKLGLTATPRDYLRGTRQSDDENRIRDPREIERRQLRDTYLTFGCETEQPTFRYSLIDGVKDGKSSGDGGDEDDGPVYMDGFNFVGQDQIATIQEQHIGYEGMKIDRMLFNRFADTVNNRLPSFPRRRAVYGTRTIRRLRLCAASAHAGTA